MPLGEAQNGARPARDWEPPVSARSPPCALDGEHSAAVALAQDEVLTPCGPPVSQAQPAARERGFRLHGFPRPCSVLPCFAPPGFAPPPCFVPRPCFALLPGSAPQHETEPRPLCFALLPGPPPLHESAPPRFEPHSNEPQPPYFQPPGFRLPCFLLSGFPLLDSPASLQLHANEPQQPCFRWIVLQQPGSPPHASPRFARPLFVQPRFVQPRFSLHSNEPLPPCRVPPSQERLHETALPRFEPRPSSLQ